MSYNRIQKLLFSEYSDFEDMVLVESPFVETTRDGRGIRQLQIGLTPSKLIIASDVMKPASECSVYYFPDRLDVEIENLELLSIFPVDLVTLSVYRRRKRKVLKAKFHDGNPKHRIKMVYLELGGSDKRNMFWNLWCERVKFLCPHGKTGSSRTETTVGTSTSDGSVYVKKTKIFDDKIWQYYEGGYNKPRWTNRDLFFGDKIEQIQCAPQPMSWSILLDNDTDEIKTLYVNEKNFDSSAITSDQSTSNIKDNGYNGHINRFGEGIEEGCRTGLYLSAMTCSNFTISIESMESMLPNLKEKWNYFQTLCDDGVKIWESGLKRKDRHPRHYALRSFPNLEGLGIGLHDVGKNDMHNTILKKVKSLFYVRETRQTGYNNQLNCSCSNEALLPYIINNNRDNKNFISLYFWTVDFWFHPETTSRTYKDNHKYLVKLREHPKLPKKSRFSKKNLFSFGKKSSETFTMSDCALIQWKQKTRFDKFVSVWDVDSTSLAFQLTMLDSYLFLRVTKEELKVLARRKTCNTVVNLITWLVFGQRCSCLFATEIVKCSDVKKRARLISRFINTAEKCHKIYNFQSCNNILMALQSPAVFRLKETWACVRRKHATRYQKFETLCHLYKDSRLPAYKSAFEKADKEPPYLPAANHIFCVLFGQTVANKQIRKSVSNSEQKRATPNEAILKHSSKLPKVFKQFLSAFKLYSSSEVSQNTASSDSQKIVIHIGEDEAELISSLKHFFEPVPDLCEDDLYLCELLLMKAKHAAKKYDLPQSELAKEYLLKTPYLDNMANYFKSLRVEPGS